MSHAGRASTRLMGFASVRRGQWNTLARLKYPTWWVQSWLAGVSRIGMGERDERGQLVDVQVGALRLAPIGRCRVIPQARSVWFFWASAECAPTPGARCRW